MGDVIDLFTGEPSESHEIRYLVCDNCECCDFTLQFCKSEEEVFIEAVCRQCTERYKVSKVYGQTGTLRLEE